MKAISLHWFAPIKGDDLPSLRANLGRGVPAFGWAILVAVCFGGVVSSLTGQVVFFRQLILTAVSAGVLVPLLWYMRGREQTRHPERALFGMVLVIGLLMCSGGWLTGSGIAPDLQYVFMAPIGVAAFAAWQPTYTLLLGALLLAGAGAVDATGVSRLTVPLWKVAELTIINTFVGAAANQLQRHLWQTIEEGRRQMAALDRVAGLGRLTAGLAHEVKTPIAATMNSLDSIRQLADELTKSIGHQGVTDDDLREIARDLQGAARDAGQATERVGQIIRRVREHTQGLHTNASVDFHVIERVQAVEALVGHQLLRGKGSIDTTGVSPDAVLHGDVGKFDQILINLIINAIEAGESAGKGASIRIGTATGPRGSIVVSVQDDGPGFTPEARARLFQPMFTTKTTGTGLGLAISRELAESALAGTLDLVPSPSGARFELRCGVAVSPEHSAAAA